MKSSSKDISVHDVIPKLLSFKTMSRTPTILVAIAYRTKTTGLNFVQNTSSKRQTFKLVHETKKLYAKVVESLIQLFTCNFKKLQ